MTEKVIIAIVAAIAVVAIVWFLRKNNFSFSGNKRGFKLDNKPPEPKSGVSVDGVKSRKGSATIENNMGDGVSAKDIEAEKDVSIRNNPGPKA